jgi:hypothetical protein
VDPDNLDIVFDVASLATGTRRRWAQLAQGALWMAALFGALTVYNVDDRDDAASIGLTAIVAVVWVGIWRAAAGRRDR